MLARVHVNARYPRIDVGEDFPGNRAGPGGQFLDGDGRIDLAVSQNGGETILLRNRSGEPGLRVRLDGPAENPRAAGAVIRLRYPDGSLGAAREIHLGSGYWSVDGAVQVLGGAAEAVGLEVRWPDGSTGSVDFSPGIDELVVTPGGDE